MQAKIPKDEAIRLKALRHYRILDTDPEAAFDDLTRLAAYICGTPVALISLSHASGIAHDLNNVLGPILMVSELCVNTRF